ncbi:putative nucleic acid-binding protein [Granulicella aggregans]|uniref:Putative nucleic acid-binding protein n=1 Tax=Granulicella aggregans TaxID=474949 RepID=A0A7W7ZHV3_9BACT|nr:PIN domain-containing protein [Granulicella aggregans]MBB5060205.1 putative nucleic acid-binding protein [Granulicella aggregans]
MPPFIVFLDANVLYPAELRSFLMYLAVSGVYRARWSAEVQDEWISNLLLNRSDLTREKLERTRELMERHAPDALVTGYQNLIPGLSLPDHNDRHVLAAAIRGKATVIITNNLKDFPAAELQIYDIEAQTPEDFINHLINLYPAEVLQAAEEHRHSLRNPKKTVEEYLDSLRRQGLVETVTTLSRLYNHA